MGKDVDCILGTGAHLLGAMPLLAALSIGAIAAVVALAAGTLTIDGAPAAAVVGGLSLAAGWSWAATLIAFFVGSTLLSHVGPRPSNLAVAKSGARDAMQVLANGGIPAVAALARHAHLPGSWSLVFAAALATANADTWATEIGRFSRARPRLITTGRTVAPGISGGITVLGTLGAVLGSVALAAACAAAGLLPVGRAYPVAFAGLAGAVIDSVLGATVQERRVCMICGAATEQRIHGGCGGNTRVAGGIAGVTNDAVNLLASGAGVVIALILT